MDVAVRRGRLYVAALILALIVFDLAIKLLLFAAGGLRWNHAIGTVVGIASCVLLWRGSYGAYALFAIGAAAALLYGIAWTPRLPAPLAAFVLAAPIALMLALLAPASRRFLAHQRAARAETDANAGADPQSLNPPPPR